MFPILNPPPSSLPISSLWVVPVHQPQASSIVHRTWTGDLFHTGYYTCFNVILPNHPTLSLSHRVQKTVLYISVSFAVSYTGLSLLAILWNSAFKWVYLSFSPLPLGSVLFSAICKVSSDSHFAFLHFFFLGMVLIIASCRISRTSVLSSSGTLSDLVP